MVLMWAEILLGRRYITYHYIGLHLLYNQMSNM